MLFHFSLISRLLPCCMIVCILFLSGCTMRSADGERGKSTSQLFPPLIAKQAILLSQEEALALARKQNFSGKRRAGFEDVAFAVRQSLAHAGRRSPQEQALLHPGLMLTYGQLAETLRHMELLLPQLPSNPELLATEFTWYRIGPDFDCTGYYEPTLFASKRPSAKYNYPLYRLPPDVRKGVPYYTRNEIDRKGALRGRGLEIAWVTSELDAFFLHVQGSGRLQYDDGSTSHVLYNGKNNRAYASLGRIMKEEGLLAPDTISMQSIRAKLAEIPERQAELLDMNGSYVFFREASKGPLGGMGYPLTPWASVAVDRRVLPHGAVSFLSVALPDASGGMTEPFHALTLPQDTGGAIKGHRLDLFCGAENDAAHVAGFLNSKGAVYMLVSKKSMHP